MSLDLGIDILRQELVKAACLGTSPSFFEPLRWRRNGLDEVLHAHNHHGGLSVSVYYKTLMMFHGTGHELTELCAGDMSINATFHKYMRPID
jgi:hypothetical protein